MTAERETHGLSVGEHSALRKILGRAPNAFECRLAGAMWSEHCSYKSTKHLLARLPQQGRAVAGGGGENAGVVDMGDGIGLAFKIESHNHPSAIAPYDGAATGLGGVVRDILAMGARPVACMAGLAFGDAHSPRTRELVNGVIQGIRDYARETDIPAVGGKTVFDASYADNPLVNAFCVGVVRLGEIVSSKTASSGDWALILGRRTNRDGVGSAEFASKELGDGENALPRIPQGDPGIEKRLIEACLELQTQRLLTSMQDMGAAGIVSSSSEVAYKSGLGIELDCERIPQETAANPLLPWELFLAETQERMFLTVKPADLDAVTTVARKHGLECGVMGKMTDDGRYRVRWNGQTVGDVPVSLLGGAIPEELLPNWRAERPSRERTAYDDCDSARDARPVPASPREALLALIGHNACTDASSGWGLFAADDRRILSGVGAPVGVIRVEGTERLAAFALDVDPWKCWVDPLTGAAESAALTLRALACAGALPLGMTDGPNYPSPQKPNQFWELEESVAGIAAASRAYDCPVVSGNVSLYNESAAARILPTPFIVACGVIEDERAFLTCGNGKEGDVLFLVGPTEGALAGSRYGLAFGARDAQSKPVFDAERERAFMDCARSAARQGLASSGRVVAGGGLLLTLAKEALASGGAKLDLAASDPSAFARLWFGEGGPRAVYAVPPASVPDFQKLWEAFGVRRVGTVGGGALVLKDAFAIGLDELRSAWRKL